MDDLLTFDTLPLDALVVLLRAHVAGMLCTPQEVEGTAIAGARGAHGGQLKGSVTRGLRVTAEGQDGATPLRAS